MKKPTKWKIAVAITDYFSVEVESFTEEQAIQTAIRKIHMRLDEEEYLTGSATNVSGIFINDRESRGFAPYVSDQSQDLEYLDFSELKDWESNSQ